MCETIIAAALAFIPQYAKKQIVTHQSLHFEASNDQPRRHEHPLRAWRRRQLVEAEDGSCRRSMRLQDIERLHGIPTSTWAGWEKWPDQSGFRRPDEANMGLIFKITKGEITPDLYYPVEEWKAALAVAGAS